MENLAPYINTQNYRYSPPDLGNTSYTNGPKRDGMVMTNNKLRLHNMATAPWRGLATGPKESSAFPVKNPAQVYSASPFFVPPVVLAARCLWRC